MQYSWIPPSGCLISNPKRLVRLQRNLRCSQVSGRWPRVANEPDELLPLLKTPKSLDTETQEPPSALEAQQCASLSSTACFPLLSHQLNVSQHVS